jgi:hypothetical protein
MKKQKILYWALTLIVIGVIIFLFDQSNRKNSKLPSEQNATILSLDPQNKTVKLGDLFAVDVILDTANSPIDGVDIFALHYNPSVIQIIDDISGQEGIQIQAGAILPINAANITDQSAGTIKFSQVAAGGTNFSGKGILATIHFKAVKEGTSDLTFDFNPGSTTDTNAAYQGQDQLNQVKNAAYTIEP